MLLAFLLLLVPLAVDSKLPPFFLGKINGQTVLNHHLNRQFVTNDASVFDDYPYLQVYNFTQKLDHFDRFNTRTWNQKYFYNPKYSRNNSIIFLMIGGEGPENGRWAAKPEVQYLQWASEFGADVFDLEHRFFGDSWPIPDMETSSLQYLTTQQALADLAFFIESMNQKYGFKNPRWVTFGGSYPGSLSAWFRQKYPQLTVGSVASSAPVNLKLDFYGNLQPPFDAKTTKLDINNFFGNLFNTFQGMTQYTYDGQSNSTHSDKTVRKMCQIMTNATEPDTVKRVENLFLWFNQMEPAGPDLSVMPNSYWDVIAQVGSGNLTILKEDGAAARGWMWLCCNEIGFLQTTNQGNNVFGTGVPLKYTTATNVVLPNGSLDPWHALGTYKTNDNQNLLPYLINGTAHCGDMYASYVGEPASLPAARAFIKQHVREFIRYNPAVDGPQGSAAFQSVFFVFSLLAILTLQ
ncbi:hypothetical protein B9Z55_022237 [Caenorhabditis nigoni]|uniref:Serine carboxypeptidase S28 n=1 Tax=Caenorhabditis nigoni TaxID=1611254 RepID=A0A2G5SJC0_9PELO|nr:hypothetical protein B9Z55_022237 [Caenorhabditis nigoni]